MQDLNPFSLALSGQSAAFQKHQQAQLEEAKFQSLEFNPKKKQKTSSVSAIQQGTSNVAVPWVDIAEPIYKSLFRHLRAEIERGRYKTGDKLPSVRTMVTDFGVSHPTVLRALEKLASLGYVNLVQGSGTYVSKTIQAQPPSSKGGGQTTEPYGASEAVKSNRQPLRANEPDGFSSKYGIKNKAASAQESEISGGDSLIPVSTWQRCVRLALQETAASRIEEPRPGGSEDLKQAIAGYVRRSRGIVIDKSQVIVTAGVSTSLALINELCRAHGDIAAVEDPGSPKIRRLLSSQGVEVQPIALDSQGISIDALKELSTKVKLLHVTPNQYPTGTLMAETRRLSLLNWAEYHGTTIVEDGFGDEYSLATNGQSTLFGNARQGTVLYLGGFRASLHPLVNTNYVLVPPALIYRALQSAALRDSEQNLLEQRSLECMLDNGHLELHLRRTKKMCKEKRALTITSLKQTLGARVDIVGTSLNGKQMLRFREDIPARSIVTAALRSGLPLTSAEEFFVEQPHSNHFLIAYALMESTRIFDTVLHFAGLLETAALNRATG